MYEQAGKSVASAMATEWERGMLSLADLGGGAARFVTGEGRHGR